MVQSKALAKPSGYRWVVFCLLAFGYLLVYFHRLCPAVVALNMQADLRASGALLGFLAAAYFYPYDWRIQLVSATLVILLHYSGHGVKALIEG